MRPEQDDASKILHLPLEDEGVTIPVSQLIDPMGVLLREIGALDGAQVEGSDSAQNAQTAQNAQNEE